ncbi:MAG: polysaccharide deacetylase family protein [Patescibacteria group bacterium]
MHIRISGFFISAFLVSSFVCVSHAQAAPLLDPLANGGFEQAQATATPAVAYDWQSFQGGYTRVNTNVHSGTWAIRFENTTNTQFSGAYQRIDIQQTEAKPLFIGGYARGTNVNKSGFGASLYVEIHFKDGTVGYWNSIPNFGTFQWRWLGFNTASIAHLKDKPIDYLFVIPLLGNASGIVNFDDITVTEYDPTQAAVTIMIDDGESNTYTAAFPIMRAKNFVGSTAVVSGSVGTSGFMTSTQVKALQTAGWEIVSHTKTHSELSLMTSSQSQAEISDSKTALQALGLVIKNIAYPFGAYNGLINAQSAFAQYGSGRAFESGDNPQGTYPFDVKVRSVLNTTTLAEVQSWLAEAKTKKRWEVIVFHTIANTGDDAYYTTPTNFQAIVNAIAQSGVPVKTYDQGLTQFTAAK